MESTTPHGLVSRMPTELFLAQYQKFKEKHLQISSQEQISLRNFWQKQ